MGKNSGRFTPLLLYLLIMLVFFQAAGALFGGLNLVLDPSGKSLGMPEGALEKMPFADFMLPGLILSLVLGLFPFFIVAGLVTRSRWPWANRLNLYRNRHWSWTYSLYLAIMLIIWIDVQIWMVGYGGLIQTFYGLLGVVILILTLSPPVMEYYQIPFDPVRKQLLRHRPPAPARPSSN